MWQWSELQIKKLDEWKSLELRDVHFAIFGQYVTDNLVKRQLRMFQGLALNEGEKLEHAQTIVKELSENALLRICNFLDINTGESWTKDKIASNIVNAISYPGAAKSVNGSVSSNLEEQLLVQQQIEGVCAEILKITKQRCDKEKSLLQYKCRLNELENDVDSENTNEIAKLRMETEALALEVQVLQAKESALVSKRDVLKTKANVVQCLSSKTSEKSGNLSAAKSNRVSEWVEAQDGQSEYHSVHEQRNQMALPGAITQMMSRQMCEGKNLEFDGSSALAWKHFIMEFESTSKRCGFSEEENVYRLAKSLKGVAREKVELLLISAKNTSKIISILNKAYGGAENIALELVTKAQRVKNVSENSDFEDFNCVVQNISSALEFTDKTLVDTQRLLAMMVEKLSENYKRDWVTFLKKKNILPSSCKFTLFAEWVNTQADLEQDVSYFKKVMSVNRLTTTNSSYSPKDEPIEQKKIKVKIACPICNEEKHSLDKCNLFVKSEVKKRWDMANRHKACYCCLKFHKSNQCNGREICNIDNCQKYHHHLLHKRQMNIATTTQNFSGCSVQSKKIAMLKLIPIKIHGPKSSMEIVAFLDEGSTSTLMDLSVARKIGLKGKNEPFCFNWTNGVYRYDPKAEMTQISISDCNGNKHELNDVWLINELKLPSQQIDYEKMSQVSNFINLKKLQNKQPMILIGQRHANLITTRSAINIDENGPILSKTKLGWVLHGPIETQFSETHYTCCQIDEDNLNQLIKRQFTIENFGVCAVKTDKTKSKEDQLALEKAKTSISKVGKCYEIGLPWKDENIKLPDSRPMAEQRLKCLERKLLRNKSTAQGYQQEIQKLLQNGYARKLENLNMMTSKKLWFLPHFAVLNPNKPGKIRLVFDAAAECNGTSLNKNLLTGPDWSTSIVGILMRFRIHKIAFVADIREMFNQVKITDDDTASQCFLWRDLNMNKEPTVYQMKAMLFGTTSSPFLAQFVKNHNAEMYKVNEPEAVKSIVENHYVDDYLDCKPTVEEAVKIIQAVISIHKEAGFELRQFLSNSPEVLKQLPQNLRSNNTVAMFGDKTDVNQKVLGVLWDAKNDIFTYSTKTMHRVNEDVLSGKIIPTKRKMLSAINSIYDPLGLVTPVTIKGRILMRDVWEAKIGWDDVLKGDLIHKWQQWLKVVKTIEEVKIPRCISKRINTSNKIELHVFNDASSKAYSSAAYLRCCHEQNGSEKFDVALIASKARVSPLKHLTIPKLETLAAVLGCRLAEVIQHEMQIKIDQRYFWTDSRTVLAWIKSENRLQTFVANRVGEICEKSKVEEWYWVSTKNNIADVITRDNIATHKTSRWLVGPEFLQMAETNWPKPDEHPTGDQPEENNVVMTIQQEEHSFRILMKRISSLNKLVRSTAWVKRFIDNARKKTVEQSKAVGLEANEIEWAMTVWCKIVQQESFPNDLQKLQRKQSSSAQRLSKYSVYLDENNVLRVAGRLERAKEVSCMTKNPIVLEGNHQFTKMLVYDMHKQAQHTGTQVVVHRFKNQYWMPKMTRMIKKVINNCVRCKRMKAKPMQPNMGWLPAERFYTHAKPFTATGIDYFGPFYVKDGRITRSAKSFRKRYGVIFTCLTTRAIHIEIAHTLSTDSCIQAIRRMMARRGTIKTIWSDNGTNFRGAARELMEALEELNEQCVASILATKGVEWKFIPASAPNFGGCWERLVGCFKRAIEAVMSVNANPNDETLQTVFCEAENLVNSRPYLLESDDPDDGIGFCPNDICIQQNGAIEIPGQFMNVSKEKRVWRVSQYLIDAFWKRFIKEYVPTLLNRQKWHRNVENLKEGDIVVMNDNVPRGEWPLGYVEKVFPGEDGVVRVVELRTAKNTYRRPVNRLCRLGVERYDKEDRAGSQH